MTRRIRSLGLVLLALYAALFVKLNWVQVVQSTPLNERPDNTRSLQRDFNRPRGDIVTADGTVIATSEARRSALRYQRRYPQGELWAHTTGYFSFTLGSSGVERTYNDELSGRTPSLRLHELTGLFADSSSAGTVVLTLRDAVQNAARNALGSRRGSVVAIDPRSGAVLGLWSSPSFDPNALSTNDTAAARAAKELLDAAPGKPLLARSYQERFFPGSTFKIVTAAAGLLSGKVTESTPVYPVVTSYTPPLTTRPIRNFGGKPCGGTLFVIFDRSCNSSFAQMAAEQLGPPPMISAAQAAGFDSVPPLDLTRPVASTYPTDFGPVLRRPADAAPVHADTPRLAQTAIGQNDVAATPLQMALVAAGVANGGQIMRPHVMGSIRASDGETVRSFDPAVWRKFVSPEVADVLRRAMVSDVIRGTATVLQIPGAEVGAKTGTAQLGTTPPTSHAWMVAFAGPVGGAPSVAVAVIVERVPGGNDQTGGRIAGVARAVLQAALAGR
ncbi:MAG: penicillin-binding transpeptidase domain-containing protein [Actinomycetes bacterium]